MKDLKVIEVQAVSKTGKPYTYLEIIGNINGKDMSIKKVYDLDDAEKSLLALVKEK